MIKTVRKPIQRRATQPHQRRPYVVTLEPGDVLSFRYLRTRELFNQHGGLFRAGDQSVCGAAAGAARGEMGQNKVITCRYSGGLFAAGSQS